MLRVFKSFCLRMLFKYYFFVRMIQFLLTHCNNLDFHFSKDKHYLKLRPRCYFGLNPSIFFYYPSLYESPLSFPIFQYVTFIAFKHRGVFVRKTLTLFFLSFNLMWKLRTMHFLLSPRNSRKASWRWSEVL